MKDQLEATGVMKVEVKSAEWATYKDNFDDKSMPMFLLGWYPDYTDPDNYTTPWAGTTGSIGMIRPRRRQGRTVRAAPGERRQGFAMVVKGVEMRVGSPVREGERKARRRGAPRRRLRQRRQAHRRGAIRHELDFAGRRVERPRRISDRRDLKRRASAGGDHVARPWSW